MTVPPNRISAWNVLLTGFGLGTITHFVPFQCKTRVDCCPEPSAAKNEPNAQISFAETAVIPYS